MGIVAGIFLALLAEVGVGDLEGVRAAARGVGRELECVVELGVAEVGCEFFCGEADLGGGRCS